VPPLERGSTCSKVSAEAANRSQRCIFSASVRPKFNSLLDDF